MASSRLSALSAVYFGWDLNVHIWKKFVHAKIKCIAIFFLLSCAFKNSPATYEQYVYVGSSEKYKAHRIYMFIIIHPHAATAVATAFRCFFERVACSEKKTGICFTSTVAHWLLLTFFHNEISRAENKINQQIFFFAKGINLIHLNFHLIFPPISSTLCISQN